MSEAHSSSVADDQNGVLGLGQSGPVDPSDATALHDNNGQDQTDLFPTINLDKPPLVNPMDHPHGTVATPSLTSNTHTNEGTEHQTQYSGQAHPTTRQLSLNTNGSAPRPSRLGSAHHAGLSAPIHHIFPDVDAPTINLTTNRSAAHIFLRQKLATIRKINENVTTLQSQPLLQQQSSSGSTTMSPTAAPPSAAPPSAITRTRSMSQFFRQHSINHTGMNGLNTSPRQSLNGDQTHPAGTDPRPTSHSQQQDPHGTVPLEPLHQEEFDFEYQDRDIKPMTQAEFDDIRKKKESSLDFSPSINNIYMIDQFATTRSRRLCNGVCSWAAVVVIAFITGCIGAALRIANSRVNSYKFEYAGDKLIDKNYGAAWGIYASWNLAMLMTSAFIVLCIEIKANGSGIPDVKAYLNGCNVRGAFSTKTLLTKLVSSALTINAGVPSGLQGPVIHLGAVTAGWVATWWKKLVMRLCCCARPYEELRNFRDIPRLPNPVSAKVFRQGYFQAVHEEQLYAAGNKEHIDAYTSNDLFLQYAGVRLAPIAGANERYGKDKNGYYHALTHPDRSDINKDGKPSLALVGEHGQMNPIFPSHIDNLTVDNDVVPTTNTARRKLAQCGISITAPASQYDDQLATDFNKAVKTGNKFGSQVNANGGIFGFVIRDKKMRVQVQKPEGADGSPDASQEWQEISPNQRSPDHPRIHPTYVGDTPAEDEENEDSDPDYYDGEMMADTTDGVLVDTQNTLNVIDLDEDSRSVATRCPRWWRSIYVPSFADDGSRREFVSIGSGAGVAAAMGAIIGGLLFALEEMSTHWSPTLGLKVLAASTISFLVASFFSSGNNGIWGIFRSNFQTFYVGSITAPYRIEEIPLYIILGIICGLLGALYIFITMNIMRWRNAIWGTRRLPKFIDTALLCILWSTICMVIAFAWPCVPVSPMYAQMQAASGASAGTFGTNRFDCPAGFHNQFAGLSFVRSDIAIKRLFARGFADSFQLPELAGWAMMYYIFCAILQQTNASYGIMVPIFVMGCSFGRLYGKLVHGWWGWDLVTASTTTVYFDPGIYAVVGAAGMFAAITRSTLSMTVVILEMTADLNLLAPALIGAFVANLTASQFIPSIFVSIIQERKLPFLSHDPPSELYRMTTKQIMTPKPTILGSCERVDHILAILESSSHAGYPVVIEPCTAVNSENQIDSNAHRGDGCDNNFIGMILRSHLLIILNRRIWRAASTPFTLQDYERVLSRAMPKLGELRARFTCADLESYVDLTPWVNRSSLALPEHMLAAQAFVLFRSLGLRHMPVINGQKHLTGVITRLELLERVVQHRWITLRKLERLYIASGGSSLAQQYVDANTAYSLVSAHALNSDLLQKSRASKAVGYRRLHEPPANPFSPHPHKSALPSFHRPASAHQGYNQALFTVKQSTQSFHEGPQVVMPHHNHHNNLNKSSDLPFRHTQGPESPKNSSSSNSGSSPRVRDTSSSDAAMKPYRP